jgi:hypothetical protein
MPNGNNKINERENSTSIFLNWSVNPFNWQQYTGELSNTYFLLLRSKNKQNEVVNFYYFFYYILYSSILSNLSNLNYSIKFIFNLESLKFN